MLWSEDVSREHAYVTWDGMKATVADAGSSNGIAVNGRQISETQPLAPGDVLQVASMELRFEAPRAEELTSALETASVERSPTTAAPASSADEPAAEGGYLAFRDEWARSDPPSALRIPQHEPAHGPERIEPRPVAVEGEHPRPSVSGRIPNRVRGIARSVDLRQYPIGQGQVQSVLAFHLDRYDASGNRLAPVAVEMVHHRRGQLTDGDEVEVSGSVKQGTLSAKRILNVTTGAEIRGGEPRLVKSVKVVLALVFAIFFIAIVIALVVSFVHSPPH
jgi:hypothetical protein